MSQKLMPAAQAPALELPLVGGGTFKLADEKPENFTMVLFYRGYHCPVCKGYLGNLAALLSDFESAGFNVVIASMNDEELATKAAQEWDLGNTAYFGLSQMVRFTLLIFPTCRGPALTLETS